MPGSTGPIQIDSFTLEPLNAQPDVSKLTIPAAQDGSPTHDTGTAVATAAISTIQEKEIKQTATVDFSVQDAIDLSPLLDWPVASAKPNPSTESKGTVVLPEQSIPTVPTVQSTPVQAPAQSPAPKVASTVAASSTQIQPGHTQKKKRSVVNNTPTKPSRLTEFMREKLAPFGLIRPPNYEAALVELREICTLEQDKKQQGHSTAIPSEETLSIIEKIYETIRESDKPLMRGLMKCEQMIAELKTIIEYHLNNNATRHIRSEYKEICLNQAFEDVSATEQNKFIVMLEHNPNSKKHYKVFSDHIEYLEQLKYSIEEFLNEAEEGISRSQQPIMIKFFKETKADYQKFLKSELDLSHLDGTPKDTVVVRDQIDEFREMANLFVNQVLTFSKPSMFVEMKHIIGGYLNGSLLVDILEKTKFIYRSKTFAELPAKRQAKLANEIYDINDELVEFLQDVEKINDLKKQAEELLELLAPTASTKKSDEDLNAFAKAYRDDMDDIVFIANPLNHPIKMMLHQLTLRQLIDMMNDLCSVVKQILEHPRYILKQKIIFKSTCARILHRTESMIQGQEINDEISNPFYLEPESDSSSDLTTLSSETTASQLTHDVPVERDFSKRASEIRFGSEAKRANIAINEQIQSLQDAYRLGWSHGKTPCDFILTKQDVDLRNAYFAGKSDVLKQEQVKLSEREEKIVALRDQAAIDNPGASKETILATIFLSGMALRLDHTEIRVALEKSNNKPLSWDQAFRVYESRLPPDIRKSWAARVTVDSKEAAKAKESVHEEAKARKTTQFSMTPALKQQAEEMLVAIPAPDTMHSTKMVIQSVTQETKYSTVQTQLQTITSDTQVTRTESKRSSMPRLTNR